MVLASKLSPYFGKLAFVSVLHRYIATCLGTAIFRELFLDLRSANFKPVMARDGLLYQLY